MYKKILCTILIFNLILLIGCEKQSINDINRTRNNICYINRSCNYKTRFILMKTIIIINIIVLLMRVDKVRVRGKCISGF